MTSGFENPSAEADGEGAKHIAAPVLTINGLGKSFGGHRVLDDINLVVNRGETVCILGPSGSGKSTLLRCINWLEEPDGGTISLSGQRVGTRAGGRLRMTDAELARVRTRVGMVFQHFALWPHMSVIQNIMTAPLHVQRRPREEVRAEALALLVKVDLLDKKDAFPSHLSGGQKQRVGIARALAMRPELMLFDEPTSALDPELTGEVLLVMKELARDGMSMLVVTHELDFAREVAGQVVFLDRGCIVERGTAESFLSRPNSERARQFLTSYARAGSADRRNLHPDHDGHR
jgi:polar amino acid transport system ATP-binding protein